MPWCRRWWVTARPLNITTGRCSTALNCPRSNSRAWKSTNQSGSAFPAIISKEQFLKVQQLMGESDYSYYPSEKNREPLFIQRHGFRRALRQSANWARCQSGKFLTMSVGHWAKRGQDPVRQLTLIAENSKNGFRKSKSIF